MAEELIKTERSADYLTIYLARPEKRNAINTAMLEQLEAALATVEGDLTIRAVCLAAQGQAFCAGIDLAGGYRRADPSKGESGPTLERAFARLENLAVPTIAAINGAAYAGGLELALHCDIRVAAQSARLGMTVARVGLLPPFDFTRKLVEVIGAPLTAEILFTAEPLDAARAMAIGMVNKVVPDGELQAAVAAMMERIAGNAPLALRGMKAAIRRSMSGAFDAPHEDLDRMVAMVRQSEDAKEGAQAFLEKRRPQWQGR